MPSSIAVRIDPRAGAPPAADAIRCLTMAHAAAGSTSPASPPSDAQRAEEARVAADLARRVAGGDTAAEGELVALYSHGVLFLLRRLTRRPELADDLHQETFRIVLERLRGPGIEDPRRLGGFVHRTARNLFLAAARKEARRKTDGETALPHVGDPRPSALDATLRGERASLVRRLLAELRPERDRQILLRYYLAEEPKTRLCTALGLTGEHFDRVLYRAKRRFRELLERSEKRRRLGAGM